MVNTQQRLLPLVFEEAAKPHLGPARQAQLSNAALDLEKQLPRQLQTAKALLEAPEGREREAAQAENDEVAKGMNAALEAILNAISYVVFSVCIPSPSSPLPLLFRGGFFPVLPFLLWINVILDTRC